MSKISKILSAKGKLSQIIEGFAPRAAQLQMAEAIEQAIKVKAKIIIEAGTGIGKTFAYLIPAFLSQKKTIISTGTKNLQDQLFFKDIPVIKALFPKVKKVVLLKGRANYLCQHRLNRSLHEGRFASRALIDELYKINTWAGVTEIGDIAEVNVVPEDSPIWPSVTSTADNCLNNKCEFYNTCFVVKARKQALAAEIVIVNHHLFFADLALQEENLGELLPGVETVIFDEAHNLPEIAAHFFSTSLSSRQLLELARDSDAEHVKEAPDMAAINTAAGELQSVVLGLRSALGNKLGRAPWPSRLEQRLENNIHAVRTALKDLEALLKEAAVRGKGLENCWQRSVKLLELFALLTGASPEQQVHWYELYPQSFSIHLTPMQVGEFFQQHLQKKKASWIFTSATLSIKNDVKLFSESLGLSDAISLVLASPFDYQRQCLLYVPRDLPDPKAPDYIERMVAASIPVIEALQGKTFILFTSYRALEQAKSLLEKRLPYPLLLQGALPKQQLIEEFKRLQGNAVLLGTSSFWYGVDVRGEALSCVIIDKLPFATPDDPLLQARSQMLRKQGLDPFQYYQLPQAIISLKQGAGRLIRDTKDYGILMICDPRLVASRYGEAFIQSLPRMPRTRDFTKVTDFLHGHESISH